MCVHRSPDRDNLLFQTPPPQFKLQIVKSKTRPRTMRRFFKTWVKVSGDVVLLWIGLSCLFHLAKCSPLRVGGGGLFAEPMKNEKSVDSSSSSITSTSGFLSGLGSSLTMMIVSELGDKTFFIAAIMAMKHPRLVVFMGAISALALMTILSSLFGFVTTYIPRIYTYYISTALFAIFGLKMLYDGALMSSDEGAEELEEVQLTLRQKEDDENTPLTSSSSDNTSQPMNKTKVHLTIRRILTSCFSKVYIQALTMTFLAEWGDRSQLATVMLASRENIVGVCVGGILGHSFCTGLAVIGGRMIAQRISVKTVTIAGGIVFLGFAVVSLFLDPNK